MRLYISILYSPPCEDASGCIKRILQRKAVDPCATLYTKQIGVNATSAGENAVVHIYIPICTAKDAHSTLGYYTLLYASIVKTPHGYILNQCLVVPYVSPILCRVDNDTERVRATGYISGIAQIVYLGRVVACLVGKSATKRIRCN